MSNPKRQRTESASPSAGITRRTLLSAAALAPAVGILGPISPAAASAAQSPRELQNLDRLTIPVIQDYFAAGRFTAVELTDAYLLRIDQLDPKIGAVILLDPSARAQAAASDTRRKQNRRQGSLDGIPVLLKDNIDTKDLQTTAGSRALLGTPPTKDAAIVTRLREAGAIILGKANLSEWANFRADRSTAGWSGVGDQTFNPYVLDRSPSASSSGSAAAVAASLSQVAIGTETNGSIVSPAGQCGVVGFKPSLGMVSRTGIIPITSEMDTAGPMARHLIDAAITFSAIYGADPADPKTSEAPVQPPESFTAGLSRAQLRDTRIGVWRQRGIDRDVDATVNQAVAVMRRAGATVIDVNIDLGEAGNLSGTATRSEFVRDLEAYLATRPNQERTLADLVEFNRNDPIELSRFDQNLFIRCLDAPSANDPSIVSARVRARKLARAAIDGPMRKYGLDAIVTAANSPAWRVTYGNGDPWKIGGSGPAAIAGYPNVCVPAGFGGELPIGLCIFGGHFQDAKILKLGAAFERAAKARRVPKYLATIG